jgi:hypothetical protein
VLFLLLAVLLVGLLVGRYVLARRGRAAFCGDGGCVTLAVLMKPTPRGLGWKHGYARLSGDLIEWRAEHKIGEGADMTFRRDSLVVDEHRPVRRGEAMLSDLCELVYARYQGEQIRLSVPRTELDTLLGWAAG